MSASASSGSSIPRTAPGRFFHSTLDTLFIMSENVGMSRKDSLAWIGLHCLIWGVYLLTLLMDPSCGNAGLDFILTLAATSLLVSLVLLIKRRTLREEEISFHLSARDEFMRVHEDVGAGRSASDAIL